MHSETSGQNLFSLPHQPDYKGIEIINYSNSTNAFTCDLPVLEILELSCCYRWSTRGVFEILAPALNKFKHELYDPQQPGHIINICGSKLLRFEDSCTFP